MELAITIIGSALKALEAAYPTIVQAITGGQSAEEAITAAREAAAAIPDRTDAAAVDLAERTKRG